MPSDMYVETPCPGCSAAYPTVVREGVRRNASGSVQRYYCKSCGRYFTERRFPGTKHPPRIIFSAISIYNLGYTLEGVAQELRCRHHAKVPMSTISSWLHRYSGVCTFHSMRKRYDLDPERTILSRRFDHGQVYDFRLHSLKSNIMGKARPLLREYLLRTLHSQDAKAFTTGSRCSESTFFRAQEDVPVSNSIAPALCSMGLETALHRRDRHDAVESFFLINDTATVAAEVPVHAFEDEINRELHGWNMGDMNGHIDLLQFRNDRIVVMDYKSETAGLPNIQSQLVLYALLLSIRTDIPLSAFRCGYFNEHVHREFSPVMFVG